MKSYKSYQTTDEKWLPEIPEGWQAIRMKYLFEERSEKGYPQEHLLVASQEMGVVPKDVYGKRTVIATKDLHQLKLVKEGDFVISLRSFQGGIEKAYYQGIISQAYTILRSKNRFEDYFKYLGKSAVFVQLLKACVTGIREGQNIEYGALRDHRLPVPSQAEQDQIVRFLDWKTSRINHLINVHKKEINKLEELKSAIIGQTVTRGLNPNAKMKNSGISWVGDIPQHWEMMPNKVLLRKRHIEVGDRFRDFQLLSLTTSGIREKDISDVKGKVPVSYEKYQIVRPNDMVFCLFDIDVSAVFSGVSHYNGMITSAYDTTECNEEHISPKYADYWFQFVFSKRYYKMYSKNVRYTIPFENFGMIKTPVPPRAEQDQIVQFLGRKASAFQRVIDAWAKKIELLKEYKNRLISDVVTGQIDVRYVAIPEYERVEEIADAEIDDETELEEAESETS